MKRIAIILLLGSFVVLGCDYTPPGKPKPEESPIAADKIDKFKPLYAEHCAGCHGADGKMGPAPALNDPLFLTIVPDDALLAIVKGGRRVTPEQKTMMPAFSSDHGGPLTNKQVEVLAQGIKKHWPDRASQPVPPYLAAKEGGSKEKGATLFAVACAGCHGSDGRTAKAGADKDRTLNDPAFLGLISDQALRRIVITGRPDLGMPAFDDRNSRPPEFQPLTSAQIDDLVALLASWRKQDAAAHGK